MVAKAAPDGYTLFMGTSGPLSINQSLYSKLPFDPAKDFAPVVLVASAPFVVAINPSVPAKSVKSVKSVKDLIALAKSKPGQLNFGAVSGSAAHLATELFKSMAGIDMVHVAYKGAAPATTDLVAGVLQLSFASTPGVMPNVKAGKVTALAVTSSKRLTQLPDIPTLAESGLAGYEASVWYGLVAPAKTPRAIIVRLNTEINKILQDPDTRQTVGERFRTGWLDSRAIRDLHQGGNREMGEGHQELRRQSRLIGRQHIQAFSAFPAPEFIIWVCGTGVASIYANAGCRCQF